MIFSDHDVFEGLAHGLLEAEVKETTQPNPIKPPVADSPAVLAVAPSVLENVSATPIATPATSEEESVALVTIPAALADELADPPIPSETTGNARSFTWQNLNTWNGSQCICHVQWPLWWVSPATQETLGSAAATVAPVSRKEHGASWRKNSNPSDFLLAQPHLEAPHSWHPKRKTQEPSQRCQLQDSKR